MYIYINLFLLHRTDLEWDDVLRDHALTSQPNFLNSMINIL